VDRLRDFQPDRVTIDPVEQANPAAEDDRCLRDGELTDQPCIEVLDGAGDRDRRALA